MQAFSGCVSAAKGDIKEALRRTFGELDSLVAGRGRKQGTTVSVARPAPRCDGVIVVLDLASGVGYTAASAGARSAAAVCSVLGAFNSESSEGRFLSRRAQCAEILPRAFSSVVSLVRCLGQAAPAITASTPVGLKTMCA